MRRSKSQAVYKFLPGMWVSDKADNGRAITAEITTWNNKKMENIYHSFIEAEIKRQIQLFGNKGGDISSYILDKDNSLSIVEPACNEGIPDIIGNISPLLFYCSSCHKTFEKKDSKQVNDYTWKCMNCNKYSIKQLSMVYSCECGYAQPIKKPFVKGVTELYYKPNQNQYKMFYTQGKSEKAAEFAILCPNCEARLVPDNAESSRNYKPFSLKIINLVDKRSGDFLEKGEEAQKIVIAKWFGKLTEKQYMDILDDVPLAFSSKMRSDEQKKAIEKQVQTMIAAHIITQEQYEAVVNTLLASQNSDGGVDQYVAACDELFAKKKNDNEELYKQWVGSYAYKLIQYDTIKYAHQVLSLQDSIDKHIELEFIDKPSEITDLNEKLGINNMQVSCDIEIINCTYGFTRKTADPVNNQNRNCRLKLNAFDRDKDGNSNFVYGAKLETEGILFEFSQRRIIEWLHINNFITDEMMPDLEDELSVKKWFAEYVKGDIINSFGEIDDDEIITKNVFGLLHSISHAIMKVAGEISGLSANSMTEIIIVETASIFIYAQTTQALPLGALSGMIENNYIQLLRKVYSETRNCMFDPVCTERDDTRCNACLIIPEISCNHFNGVLGRKYLYSIKESNIPVGFWEM